MNSAGGWGISFPLRVVPNNLPSFEDGHAAGRGWPEGYLVAVFPFPPVCADRVQASVMDPRPIGAGSDPDVLGVREIVGATRDDDAAGGNLQIALVDLIPLCQIRLRLMVANVDGDGNGRIAHRADAD